MSIIQTFMCPFIAVDSDSGYSRPGSTMIRSNKIPMNSIDFPDIGPLNRFRQGDLHQCPSTHNINPTGIFISYISFK